MPFYEYECPACKFYTEVLAKISDKPLKKCPSCGKAGFKRLVSAPVFRLKGSGWYETDFKSDKEGQRNLVGKERDEAKAAAPDPKAPSDNKSDSKGETKGDDQGAAKAEAPAGDKAKGEKAAPAAERGKNGKSSAGAARSSGAKRPMKPAPKRAAKRPARTAARGSRRR